MLNTIEPGLELPRLKPVLCATDPNTDIGKIAEENGYGYWCESNSVKAFTAIVDKMIQADRKAMGGEGVRVPESELSGGEYLQCDCEAF